MDKYEYKVRSEEIKSLIGQGSYAQAAEIADTIDWRRVKSVMMLCTVSDLYKINRRYEDAKNMLLLAYERRPGGRTICYSLCELCIKTEEFVQALKYYKEFVQAAPKDSGRYILQYKLYEAQEVSLEERISVLEELKKRDYREKWAYELAYLYHRVGLGTRCVEECDELILWFGEGKYVVKAMELKMLHQPLTPAQREAYDRRFEEAQPDKGQEDQEYYEDGADYGSGGSEGQEEYGWPPEERPDGEGAVYGGESASPQEEPGELDIQVKTMDVGKYNTINLQAELAAGLQEVLGAEDMARESGGAEEMPGAQAGGVERPSGADYRNYGAEEIEDSEVFFGATGEIEDTSLEFDAPEAGAEETGAWQEYEPGAEEDASWQEYESGEEDASGQEYEAGAEDASGQEYAPGAKRTVAGEMYVPGAEETAAREMYASGAEKTAAGERHVPGAEKTVVGERHAPGAEKIASGQEPAPVPEKYIEETGARQPERQEESTVPVDADAAEKGAAQRKERQSAENGAEPRQDTQPPKEMAEVLSQEANGQISIVLPESAAIEKQITGQMKLEDILAEWERIKKANEAKCQEEVRRHVLSQTGPMFTEFEAAVRDGLLEQLEKGERQQKDGERTAMPEQTGAAERAAYGEKSGEAQEAGDGRDDPQEAAFTDQAGYEEAKTDGTACAEEAGYEQEQAYIREAGYGAQAAYAEYIEGAGTEEESGYEEDGAYADGNGYGEETGFEGEPGDAVAYETAGGPENAVEYEAAAALGYAGEYEAAENDEAYEAAGPGYAEAYETGEAPENAEAYEAAGPGYAEAYETGEAPEYAREYEAAEDEEYEAEQPLENAVEYEAAAALGYGEEYEAAGPEYTGEHEAAEAPEYTGENGYGAETGEDAPEYIEEPGYEDEAPYAGNYEEYGDEADGEADYGESAEDAAFSDKKRPFGVSGTEEDDIVGEIEEIQEQVEASERPKRAETAQKDQNRAGDKPAIEREQAKVRSLTREEKELFAPYIQNRRSREQLVKALDSVSMAAYTGNLIITGEEGMDTLTLAKNMMREIRMIDSNFSGKVAKVSGEGLNGKDVAQTLEQLNNGALIIQKASGMSSKTAGMLHRQLQHERFGIIVVLEDTEKAIKKLFLGTPDLYGDFTARVDLEALSNDALVAFGRQYAREKEYSIDNLGVLALHTRIEELQTIDHVVTVMEVKQIMDEAIHRASRKTLGHFFDILLARRYDDEDMVILTEKDFVA